MNTDKAHMEAILEAEGVGHLGLAVGDEAYVVPLNFAYVDGRILFHCALEGKKLDMIRANPRVCFEVSRQQGAPTEHVGDLCDNPFHSVVCWGVARIVEDLTERVEVLNAFQARFNTPQTQRAPISTERAARCGAVEITVSRMTGRRWGAGENIRWEWEA